MVLTIAFINWTHMVIVVSRTQVQRLCLEQLCNTFDGNEQRVSFQLNVYTIVFKRTTFFFGQMEIVLSIFVKSRLRILSPRQKKNLTNLTK